MRTVDLARPDVTLHLDLEGMIRKVLLSDAIGGEDAEAWLGRPWAETIGEGGGRRVQRMLEDARRIGVSGFREVAQRFPSGRELPMRYTTVRLAGEAGLVAIGKSVQAVADLQARLSAAQRGMERESWRLREIETRYRLLLDATSDALLLVRDGDLEVVEASPAAARALGGSLAGRAVLPQLAPQERGPFQAMLERVRAEGKAPSMLVHFGAGGRPWLARASLMTAEPSPLFLLRLAATDSPVSTPEGEATLPLEALLERAPDGFVVADRKGQILHANQAFLDLIQVPAKGSVIGQRLGRWLGRPGADLGILLGYLDQHGVVRRFATSLHGELGAASEVELSAAGERETRPRLVAILLRDVGDRPGAAAEQDNAIGASLAARPVGGTSLLSLVQDTVSVVERHYVAAALDLTRGNRTAAAELLGLSRQSLYAKLRRYGL